MIVRWPVKRSISYSRVATARLIWLSNAPSAELAPPSSPPWPGSTTTAMGPSFCVEKAATGVWCPLHKTAANPRKKQQKRPAPQSHGFRYIQKLSGCTIRTCRIPLDFACKSYNLSHQFCKIFNGQFFTGSCIHSFIPRIVVHQEHAQISQIIYI